MSNCKCSDCNNENNFDVAKAYTDLHQKYTQLADVMVKYMSEAGLNRDLRVENASTMADLLSRIVGGTPVTDGRFPECCLVGNQSRYFCTGVLVHPRIVLTAAHCLPNITRVRLNCTTEFDPNGIEIPVQKVRIHPEYNRIHDIGVLILPPNDRVPQHAEIATTKELLKARDTTLVGFGTTDFAGTIGFGLKRQVSVSIDQHTNIDEAEARLGFESDFEFTAGGDGKDTCGGDSGGPAYIVVNGKIKVAALTSRALRNASQPCGLGGIYTRIDVHLDFIRRVAQESGITF
jgi:endonuclease G